MNTKYKATVLQSMTGFLGVYDLDLICIETMDYDYAFQIVVVDKQYQKVPFFRNVSNFSIGRRLFKALSENSEVFKNIDDVYNFIAENHVKF